MVDNFKKFMAKLISDDKLKEDFKSVASKGSMEDTYQFALKNSDGGFTKEEFEEYISELMGEIEYAKENLLKDKLLENVAGGINLPGEKYWDQFQIVNPDFDDGTMDEGHKALGDIYRKELKLQQKRNKAETIQEGIGTASNVVELISTLGNIGLGIRDIKKQDQIEKDKALDRKVKHYENMLALHELEEQCKELGIKLD